MNKELALKNDNLLKHCIEYKNQLVIQRTIDKCLRCQQIPFDCIRSTHVCALKCNIIICEDCLNENPIHECPLCKQMIDFTDNYSDELTNYLADVKYGRTRCKCGDYIYRSFLSSISNFDYWEQHFQVCPEKNIDCTYGCEKVFKLKDMRRHQQEECPYMNHICINGTCHKQITREDNSFPLCNDCEKKEEMEDPDYIETSESDKPNYPDSESESDAETEVDESSISTEYYSEASEHSAITICKSDSNFKRVNSLENKEIEEPDISHSQEMLDDLEGLIKENKKRKREDSPSPQRNCGLSDIISQYD